MNVNVTKIPADLVNYHDKVEQLVAHVDGRLSLNDPAVAKLPQAKEVKEAWETVLKRHDGNWKTARAEYLRCYPVAS